MHALYDMAVLLSLRVNAFTAPKSVRLLAICLIVYFMQGAHKSF